MSSTYELVLTTLKYAGLVTDAASSLWTATHVISKEDAGKKRLTSAGKIALALTILGFAISFTSSILQDRLNSQKARQAAAEELRKTRLILAAQPLANLSIHWTVRMNRKLCLRKRV